MIVPSREALLKIAVLLVVILLGAIAANAQGKDNEKTNPKGFVMAGKSEPARQYVSSDSYRPVNQGAYCDPAITYSGTYSGGYANGYANYAPSSLPISVSTAAGNSSAADTTPSEPGIYMDYEEAVALGKKGPQVENSQSISLGEIARHYREAKAKTQPQSKSKSVLIQNESGQLQVCNKNGSGCHTSA